MMCKLCPDWQPASYIPVPPDEITIDRLVAGDRPARARPCELAAAVRILTGYGHSARLISERLGITERTVCRHRARLRSASTRELAR